ncbi:MAG: HlyD family efflux transporter periplasmic adaptor subunit [Planctomycetes bacterium]|nr:HlyD family efflux transporter periplasmic adaptor subunit [Planctomycetota bacterium]
MDRGGVDLRRRGSEPDGESVALLPNNRISPELLQDPVPNLERATTPAIDRFAVQIHKSLKPRDVTTIAAQELRPILGCERICFLERRGRRFRLVAASGHAGLPPRSRQAALMEQLVAMVLRGSGRFLAPDERTPLPDDVSRQLASYWDVANGHLILVEPIYGTLPTEDAATDRHAIVGALVLEQFTRSSLPAETMTRLDSATQHLTLALANARRYARLTSIPGLYHMGLIVDVIRRSTTVTALLCLMMVAELIACTCIVQRPFEVECHGRLMPVVRRDVFAGLDGEVVEILVNESDQVEEGQVIARLQSRDLEKGTIEQTGLLKGKLKARDAARAELLGRSNSQVRSQTARDQAQLEIINAEIETIHRQLALLELQSEQLVIRAPISGTVTTERPREKLLGRPVRCGEALLEIMNEADGWQLELAVAEHRIGHLLTYQQQHPDANVTFRLLANAQHSLNCTVTRLGDRTLPSTELGSYSRVFCDVSQVDLPSRQVGSEVSARIQCGRQSLAYIWFHEFWELLQRNWWV